MRYSPEEAMMHEKVMKMVPTFKDMITTLSKDPVQLKAFIAYLGSAAASVRQEDTASLKNNILVYILNDLREDYLDPPVSKMDTKICVMDMHTKFLNNWIEFMEKVKDGTYCVKTSGWPTFLYDLVANQYDRKNKDHSLFCGPLIQVFRHIFTGPLLAFGSQRKGTKPSKAEIHQMMAVTGQTIAYAAVQTHFALSSVKSWSSKDGEFNYEVFFNNIMDLFETLRPMTRTCGLLKP
ncbi:hypothetical protein DFH94DRAFT_687459 [Russula ochroleuca]|uniref:Uncharacterized protein n=1 Tax=Russula ochroleuca TaxID=152965 RepID=A0A9P5N5L2_9AGAM|nr:hypothetical protein DFH94DRAFT_687459 [Russula ochroleuca]